MDAPPHNEDREAYIKQLEAQLKEANERAQLHRAGETKKSSSFKTFLACQPPTFGGSNDPTVTETWIREMELAFESSEYEGSKKVTYAKRMLRGRTIA